MKVAIIITTAALFLDPKRVALSVCEPECGNTQSFQNQKVLRA